MEKTREKACPVFQVDDACVIRDATKREGGARIRETWKSVE